LEKEDIVGKDLIGIVCTREEVKMSDTVFAGGYLMFKNTLQ
jgi:hypothetical protein